MDPAESSAARQAVQKQWTHRSDVEQGRRMAQLEIVYSIGIMTLTRKRATVEHDSSGLTIHLMRHKLGSCHKGSAMVPSNSTSCSHTNPPGPPQCSASDCAHVTPTDCIFPGQDRHSGSLKLSKIISQDTSGELSIHALQHRSPIAVVKGTHWMTTSSVWWGRGHGTCTSTPELPAAACAICPTEMWHTLQHEAAFAIAAVPPVC